MAQEETRGLTEFVLRLIEDALRDPDRPGVYVFRFGTGGDVAAWQVALFLILLCVLYFLPTAIAFTRRHGDRIPITILNFLVGWSGVGWIAMLVWAFIDRRAPK